MSDRELLEEVYRRFHSMQTEFSERIMNLPIDDLPFTDATGGAFGKVVHLVRGDDKSGAAFDIYRLGWYGGRVWELVIIDGVYLPHAHQKISSEFFIFTGRGHLSRGDEWTAYQERTRVSVGMGVAHGFITDPEIGPTVFISIQSDPIRKILTDQNTKSESFEDDFVYVDDKFSLPQDLLQIRNRKAAAKNPFFAEWTTPFGLPPFADIRPEHFPAAFDRGIAEHDAEIAAIAGSVETPSFANTIEELERSGRLLDRVSRVFFNLEASRSDDAIDGIAREYAPRLAQHRSRVALDPALYARIAELHARRGELGLDADQLRLLERLYLRLVRAGALLAPAEKARMVAINQRLASLGTLFGQNLLHDERDRQLVLGADDLDGLPDFVRDPAAAAAAARGRDGQWVVTLARSSVEPFLTFSPRRDLREALWRAWTMRGAHPGAHDNRPLIREILELRDEQARLLGCRDFPHYRLEDSMAKDAAAVERLLLAVWEPAKKKAAEERTRLERAAREAGQNEPIEPWDWRYWAERVRRAEYDLDEAEVKPFFVLDDMTEAAFDTARRLFGLGFSARPDLEAHHPDVRVWEVHDRTGAPIGLFLGDNFARPDKRSGAWSSRFRDQENLDTPVLPIVVNSNNFAKAEPTLLSFDDARTLFHEFGHALHGLLSRVRYRSQSGTAVLRDFVEFPSQIFEHWLSAPENLRRHARHYRTGAPIPEALIRRLLAAREFDQGFATVEYTASALLDLELHRAPAAQMLDIDAFEAAFRARFEVPPEIGLRHRPAHFQHLFAGGGYAAGYYAYLWAEVLDADGFAAFTEAGDAFDPTLAARLEEVYAAGDSREPMALYRAFRGRDPRIEALLAQRGLAAAEAARPENHREAAA